MGKEGLANLTASLLQEGSQNRSAEAIQAQLDKLGSSIQVVAELLNQHCGIEFEEKLAGDVANHPRDAAQTCFQTE